MRIFEWTLAAVVLIGCGGSSGPSGGGAPPDSGSSAPAGPTIRITDKAFNPSELTVDAGTTIVLLNDDGTSHTVTSESADGAFVAGAVAGVSFDSGAIPAASTGGGVYGGGGTSSPGRASITLPAGAPSGTVIPFFCNVHKGMMTPANGHITIR